MLFLFLGLNFGISFWNAYSSGAYLTETKIIGGFSRFMVWCGLVMSACGFTWVYLTILTMIAVSCEWLTPHWGEVMFKLGYLVIIGPVLGSGLAIWAHSIVVAYRRRNLSDVAVAAWNTYAQVSNTWEAASHAPGFLKEVMSAFSSTSDDDDDDNKGAQMGLLVILLVILAVFGGVITTGVIARWADREVALDVTRARGNLDLA
ncbi:MAG: hypothetical protein K8Q97_01915 [Candidatus Andersenbacteria bacterium]|nr:hypothetical protein [Candidatus Andersenbacteria bacterium]